MLVLMKMLDEPQESARIYHSMTELRLQAEPVPHLMGQYAGMPAAPATSSITPRSWMRLSGSTCPTSTRRPIFESIDNGGWCALRFESDVLGSYAAEGSLTKDQEADYLAQVRAVIDAVASDETPSPSDRSRIVDLLRKVEQALVDIKINGGHGDLDSRLLCRAADVVRPRRTHDLRHTAACLSLARGAIR